MVTKAVLASKRVRAFRSKHRIIPIEVGQDVVQCQNDGIRIFPVKGGHFRHDVAEVERLVVVAGPELRP